jgi:PAS domain S-box-containing protein
MDAARRAQDRANGIPLSVPSKKRPAAKRRSAKAPPAMSSRTAVVEPVFVPGADPLPVSNEVLRLAFARSPSGMTISALDGRWLWVNDAYCGMLGYEPDELLRISHREVTHPDDVDGDTAFVAGALAGECESQEGERRYVRKDGSVLWAWVVAQVIRDSRGQPMYLVSHVQDVSDRKQAETLQRDTARTLRSVMDNTPAVICVKGRDHRYKLVNREFEQVYGVSNDWIVGRSDAEFLSPSTLADVHAREDAVLDSGVSSQEETTSVDDHHGQVLLTTRFPLLDEAGVICGVCTASTDITERRGEERSRRERLQCSELIYSALAEGRFVLYAQPIVHLASMTSSRAELLIRLRPSIDDGELLAPGSFLPDAERFGLITLIDEWVVDHGIEFARAGHRVTVNVSAKTVSAEGLVDRIEEAIVDRPGCAANLVFEITETSVADNLDAARIFATRMRALGCAIALDDFGVGHGTFTYLRHLPVDYLKIDMQFVRNLLRDTEDQQVVQAIVGVARQFGIETIAEGVEDQATMTTLRSMGVDYAQGFLTGRPMELDRCFETLDKPWRGAPHAAAD